MKNLLLGLAGLVVLSLSANAQHLVMNPLTGKLDMSIQEIVASGAPSNPCPSAGTLYVDSLNSNSYFCAANGGNWVQNGTGTPGPSPFNCTLNGTTSTTCTHNLSTTSVIVQCYDASSPPLAIIPNSIALTSANVVTVGFTANQTGSCKINGGVGPQGPAFNPIPSNTILGNATGGSASPTALTANQGLAVLNTGTHALTNLPLNDNGGARFDVLSFGASGSDTSTTTVGTTAPGTTLTVTSCASFTPSDFSNFGANSGVSIDGAGVAAARYVGTLVSCSGTTMTVSPATSTSVSAGAVVRHNDTVAIAAAITAASANSGSIVILPRGVYRATIQLSQGVIVMGASQTGTIIRSDSGDLITMSANGSTDEYLYNLTLNSVTGGGHAINLATGGGGVSNCSFRDIVINQGNPAKSAVYSRTTNLINVQFDSIVITHSNNTVPTWDIQAPLFGTNRIQTNITNGASSTACAVSIIAGNGGESSGNSIDAFIELPAGGGVCLQSLSQSKIKVSAYDTPPVSNPVLSITKSSTGLAPHDNTVWNSFSTVATSSAVPDLWFDDQSFGLVLLDSHFGKVNGNGGGALSVGTSVAQWTNASYTSVGGGTEPYVIIGGTQTGMSDFQILQGNPGDFQGITRITQNGTQLMTFNAAGQVGFGGTQPNAPTATISGGAVTGTTYLTKTNCASSASPAVCGSSAAGMVVIAAGATSVVVNTTAVTANSEVQVSEDQSLGTALTVTCNTQALTTLGAPRVTARTAATSFTISIDVAPTTNPMCVTYSVVN